MRDRIYFLIRLFFLTLLVTNSVLCNNHKTKIITLKASIDGHFVEDYPLDNAMIYEKHKENYSQPSKTKGYSTSKFQYWFTNDTLQQTLIFEMYSDGRRHKTIHFDNNKTFVFFDQIELKTLVTHLDHKYPNRWKLNSHLKEAEKISSKYFCTDNRLKIGDSKNKALSIYGKPDNTNTQNEIEIFEWYFTGIGRWYDLQLINEKPLIVGNFLHKVSLYLKNDEIVGIILYNDIP